MKYNVALQRAIQLVMTAFGDKIRTGPNNVPMWTHSVRVGLSLLSYGYSLGIVLVGLLHDLIEDTDVTGQMIENLFSTTIRLNVETCSFDPKLGDTPAGIRDIRRRVLLEAESENLVPLIVKIADHLDNLKTNGYLKPEFQHSQYRRGVEWVADGKRYLPGYWIVEDLAIVVEREHVRLGL